MRVLLIAYEYPPSPSPQSLRWMYLTRELARRGHEVHVLCPDLPVSGPGPAVPPTDGIVVHRTFPGPWVGLIAALSRRDAQRKRIEAGAEGMQKAAAGPVALNWKGRLQTWVSRVMGALLFPDARAEWWPFARRRLAILLPTITPDVVVASHEPATSLALGLAARRLGYRYLADLGDPVLADYTPGRWRRRAWVLEARICRDADGLSMTTPDALDLLAGRHGCLPAVARVLTQGFDAASGGLGEPAVGDFDPRRLELLYTGSFYDFRAPDALLEAVRRTPGVRLTVVSREAPAALVAAGREAPESFRLFGHLPHERALALQRGADVLVNLGNPSPVQVPGKVYEYLGADRPILHIRSPLAKPGESDPVASLLAELHAGVAADGSSSDIAVALGLLLDARRRRASPEGFDPEYPARHKYSWQHLGGELESMLAAIANSPRADAITPTSRQTRNE